MWQIICLNLKCKNFYKMVGSLFLITFPFQKNKQFYTNLVIVIIRKNQVKRKNLSFKIKQTINGD